MVTYGLSSEVVNTNSGIVAVLYFLYDNETLILHNKLSFKAVSLCPGCFVLVWRFFPLNLLRSLLDIAKAEGQTL